MSFGQHGIKLWFWNKAVEMDLVGQSELVTLLLYSFWIPKFSTNIKNEIKVRPQLCQRFEDGFQPPVRVDIPKLHQPEGARRGPVTGCCRICFVGQLQLVCGNEAPVCDRRMSH